MLAGCLSSTLIICSAYGPASPPRSAPCSLVCGQSLLVEQNGDVYSCDHFVSAEYKLGNLKQDAMAAMASSPFQQQFGKQRANSLPAVRAATGALPAMEDALNTVLPSMTTKHRITSVQRLFNLFRPYHALYERHEKALLNCQPPALIMSLIPEIRQNILQLTESEDERTK